MLLLLLLLLLLWWVSMRFSFSFFCSSLSALHQATTDLSFNVSPRHSDRRGRRLLRRGCSCTTTTTTTPTTTTGFTTLLSRTNGIVCLNTELDARAIDRMRIQKKKSRDVVSASCCVAHYAHSIDRCGLWSDTHDGPAHTHSTLYVKNTITTTLDKHQIAVRQTGCPCLSSNTTTSTSGAAHR